jgi:hypothetical protein
MSLVPDAGALIAIESGNRELIAALKVERQAGRVPLTHGGVVGQVWRGGARKQARLAQALPFVEIAPLDERLGKRAGVLLSRAAGEDVMDAAIVLIAGVGDQILTSDPDDLEYLAEAGGIDVEIVPV